MSGRLGHLGDLGRLGRLGGFDRPRANAVASAQYTYTAVGADTFVAPAAGRYDVYAYGPGGIGGESAGTTASRGGGGGAAKIRWRLRKDETLSLFVGQVVSLGGTSTTVTKSGQPVLTGGKGGNGAAGEMPGGAAGVGSNGDVNRAGGVGIGDSNPDGDPNTADGVNTATLAEGGDGSTLGGGAGFPEDVPGVFAGAGGIGGIFGAPAPDGAPGKIVIVGPV